MYHEENPSKLSTTLFLVFLPNHLFCQEVVEVVIAWKGKSMGKFKLSRAPSFGMSCFACMDKKTPEPYAIFDRHVHVLDFFSCFESCGTFWFINHSPPSSFPRESNIVVAMELFMCVSFVFCKCFSLGKTVIAVLQRCLRLQSI